MTESELEEMEKPDYCGPIGWEECRMTVAEINELCDLADLGDIDGAAAVADRARERMFELEN